MLAFLDDPKIKKNYLARVIAHRKADEIRKGFYWENGKGCAVGCTIHSNRHSDYETELGIPEMLARLEDNIFEGASNAWAKTWPERFLKAIKPGADLSKVGWQFQHWMLLDPKEGVIRFARPQDKELFKTIGSLICDLALGKQIDVSAARSAALAALAASAESAALAASAESAESAAWSTAESAALAALAASAASAAAEARSAAESAALAASAAWSAARSAALAARSAALAARSAALAARSAARSAAYERQGEKLLKLLVKAKVKKESK